MVFGKKSKKKEEDKKKKKPKKSAPHVSVGLAQNEEAKNSDREVLNAITNFSSKGKQRERIWSHSFTPPAAEAHYTPNYDGSGSELLNGPPTQTVMLEDSHFRAPQDENEIPVNPISDEPEEGVKNHASLEREVSWHEVQNDEIIPSDIIPSDTYIGSMDPKLDFEIRSAVSRMLLDPNDDKVTLAIQALDQHSDLTQDLQFEFLQSSGLKSLSQCLGKLDFKKQSFPSALLPEVTSCVQLQYLQYTGGETTLDGMEAALLPTRVRAAYLEWYKDPAAAHMAHAADLHRENKNPDSIINNIFSLLFLYNQKPKQVHFSASVTEIEPGNNVLDQRHSSSDAESAREGPRLESQLSDTSDNVITAVWLPTGSSHDLTRIEGSFDDDSNHQVSLVPQPMDYGDVTETHPALMQDARDEVSIARLDEDDMHHSDTRHLATTSDSRLLGTTEGLSQNEYFPPPDYDNSSFSSSDAENPATSQEADQPIRTIQLELEDAPNNFTEPTNEHEYENSFHVEKTEERVDTVGMTTSVVVPHFQQSIQRVETAEIHREAVTSSQHDVIPQEDPVTTHVTHVQHEHIHMEYDAEQTKPHLYIDDENPYSTADVLPNDVIETPDTHRSVSIDSGHGVAKILMDDYTYAVPHKLTRQQQTGTPNGMEGVPAQISFQPNIPTYSPRDYSPQFYPSDTMKSTRSEYQTYNHGYNTLQPQNNTQYYNSYQGNFYYHTMGTGQKNNKIPDPGLSGRNVSATTFVHDDAKVKVKAWRPDRGDRPVQITFGNLRKTLSLESLEESIIFTDYDESVEA